MPPVSNLRKASLLSNDASSNPSARRTQSGRAIRTNTTRPANYYARPFGSFSVQSPADEQHDVAPGFFPALEYFTDAITALPREVIRQFTLMKEVEAKVHGPTEKLDELVGHLMDLPVPVRKSGHGQSDANGITVGGRLLGLSANNSIAGSANPSVINGVPGGLSTQNSIAESLSGEEMPQAHQESEDDLERRRRFHELKVLAHQLLPNLDEKNVVLAEANRVLALQLSRLEDVWPHVVGEIPEEAMLGSMTHWAYSDNRQKKVAPTASDRNRRDVGAANALAAAANAMHETEIAAARREANREATRDKHRGRQARDNVESDFDEKPKKLHPKTVAARARAAAAAATATAAGQSSGLGITNGEPTKRRKVDKALAAPGMERTSSAKGKAARETPRSTPAAEPAPKKIRAKPPPLPKKKGLGSAANSPAMASSPLHSSFNPSNLEQPPPSARPASARLRQNSTTNLRHEKAVEDGIRPASAAGKSAKSNGKRKALHEESDAERPPNVEVQEKAAQSSVLKHEEAGSARDTGSPRLPPLRTNSGEDRKGSASARNSKTNTPRAESFADAPPSLNRIRSTRTTRVAGRDSSNDDDVADATRITHKRMNSNSHILKQLAPYNKSPNIDRHNKDDMDEDLESNEGQMADEGFEPTEAGRRGRSKSHSGRNSGKQTPAAPPPRRTSSAISPPPESEGPVEEEEDPDATMEDIPPATSSVPQSAEASREPSPEVSAVPSIDSPMPEAVEEYDEEEEDEEEEDSDHDPDDPKEPKYCYCQRGSYGEMVACDNDACPREWFHIQCTELRVAPAESEVWYCRDCRPKFVKKRGARGRG